VRVAGRHKQGRAGLCRYVSRPPLSEAQLRVLDEERVELSFRCPLRSGQNALILHPLSLMKRLAWWVPPPGQHQIRYVGVLGPNARLRPEVVPVAYRMGWARLLSQVYEVDGHGMAMHAPVVRGRFVRWVGFFSRRPRRICHRVTSKC
jgi:hypothetical protein